MKIKTRDLVVFEAVAQAGSIQAAAERVGMTQSAVTRAIKRLEEALGRQLLDRHHRPVGLTGDGLVALEQAQSILGAVRQLEDIFAADAPPTGPFRLGLPHALVPRLLSAESLLGLAGFVHLQPQISAGWSHELHAKLDARELDAAITIDTPSKATSPGIKARILARAELAVLSAADHAAPADLEAANAVGWALSPEGCGYRAALVRALHAHGLSPLFVLETNSIETQLLLTRQGQALTLSPAWAGQAWLTEGRLHLTRLAELEQTLQVTLSVPASARRFDPVHTCLEKQAVSALSK